MFARCFSSKSIFKRRFGDSFFFKKQKRRRFSAARTSELQQVLVISPEGHFEGLITRALLVEAMASKGSLGRERGKRVEWSGVVWFSTHIKTLQKASLWTGYVIEVKSPLKENNNPQRLLNPLQKTLLDISKLRYKRPSPTCRVLACFKRETTNETGAPLESSGERRFPTESPRRLKDKTAGALTELGRGLWVGWDSDHCQGSNKRHEKVYTCP